MYKPAAKRRWGYFALPILYDRLVGKPDVANTSTMTAAVRREIDDPARWLELELTLPISAT